MPKKRGPQRAARPRHEEEDISTPADDREEVPREQHELDNFFESLGSAGVTEVTLWRRDPSGKYRFLTSGPVSQFSDLMYVQQTFKGGDYQVKGRLNGRHYGSQSFSVADPPGSETPRVTANDSEVERLRAQIESQRLEMERDRQDREQRNHELLLKTLEGLGAHSAQQSPQSASTIGELVRAIKDMHGMTPPPPPIQW
jgi:hypothetical protein